MTKANKTSSNRLDSGASGSSDDSIWNPIDSQNANLKRADLLAEAVQNANANAPPVYLNGSNGFSKNLSNSGSTHRPIIFNRETSITSQSKLSVNLSLNGKDDAAKSANSGSADRGPTVTFTNLNYRIRNHFASSGYMPVLSNVSGQFDWGKLSLVLGARASGRSSLLHILAGDRGLASEVSGDILFDGMPCIPSQPLWQRCGLVEAQDEQHRDLYVEEIVTFAMKLRYPDNAVVDDRLVRENVNRTIELLRLDSVRKTVSKKLSPGERRRLSIAEEIVHGPGLLLIDEPTTNQDIADEVIMMQSFREMVNQDRTVVAAVHSPSAQVLQLFDKILLLCKGHVIFHGPPSEATTFFTKSPFAFSIHGYDNPGDFLTDISGCYVHSAKDEYVTSAQLSEYYQSTHRKYSAVVAVNVNPKLDAETAAVDEDNHLGDSQASYFITKLPLNRGGFFANFLGAKYSLVGNMDANEELLAADAFTNPTSVDSRSVVQVKGYPSSSPFYLLPYVARASVLSLFHFFLNLPHTHVRGYWRKSVVLLHRSYLSVYRRPKLWLLATLTHVLLACFLGGAVGGNAVTVVYNVASLYGVGTLLLLFINIQIIYYYFRIKQVFLKEHSRGLYSVFQYWSITSWPLYILRGVNGLLYCSILYGLTKLGSTTELEWYFICCGTSVVVLGSVLTEVIIVWNQSLRAAYVATGGLMLFFFIFSGLFAKYSSLPGWLQPVVDVSPIRWSMQGSFINTYEDNTTVFLVVAGTSTYDLFLTLFSWNGVSKWFCVVVIFLEIAASRLILLAATGITAIAQKGGRKFRKEENIDKSLNN